jgi:hypothetical protein
MNKKSHKLSIRRIGGTRQFSLELRGTVLLVHESGWIGNSSTFIPVEWVEVSRQMKWSATIRKRPTVLLTVDDGDRPWEIEFWHSPGGNMPLEQLIARLESLQDADEPSADYPVHMSYSSHKLKPVRIALTKTAWITALLVLPVAWAAWALSLPAVGLFLVAPLLWYLGRHAIARARTMFMPTALRLAGESLRRGDYAAAETHLAESPETIDTAMLTVYLRLEQRDFDKALKECQRVSRLNPDAGQDLMEEVWGYKRIHQRMGDET